VTRIGRIRCGGVRDLAPFDHGTVRLEKGDCFKGYLISGGMCRFVFRAGTVIGGGGSKSKEALKFLKEKRRAPHKRGRHGSECCQNLAEGSTTLPGERGGGPQST